jgi:hypothetical protein
MQEIKQGNSVLRAIVKLGPVKVSTFATCGKRVPATPFMQEQEVGGKPRYGERTCAPAAKPVPCYQDAGNYAVTQMRQAGAGSTAALPMHHAGWVRSLP